MVVCDVEIAIYLFVKAGGETPPLHNKSIKNRSTETNLTNDAVVGEGSPLPHRGMRIFPLPIRVL